MEHLDRHAQIGMQCLFLCYMLTCDGSEVQGLAVTKILSDLVEDITCFLLSVNISMM